MEVSALKYHGGLGLHSRSPLLRLQSDERLVAYVRRGNVAAFETLVSRYESRLLAFCRHLLGSREDAEDILQEVLAAAFNAILADDRPIKVRPWLYRIARNRSLNHLRRNQAVGVDSMDVHFSDNGASTADKAHDREEFRLLVDDIQDLPETQRTALVLREMDALSYEQIAEAMETTVPSVKSLLVRARVSLAEAAEARLLSCDQVRLELGEVAEGLRRRPGTLVRRHLRSCERCSTFRVQLRDTNKALAALLPFGPLVVLKKLVFTHLGHSAGSSAAGSGAGTAGSTAAGGTAAGGTALGGSAFVASTGAGGSLMSAGIGAVATKAAAGIAAAALVTAGAVEVDSSGRHVQHQAVAAVAPPLPAAMSAAHALTPVKPHPAASHAPKSASKKTTTTSGANSQTKTNVKTGATGKTAGDAKTHALRAKSKTVAPPPGRTVTTTDQTNLQSGTCGSAVATAASDPAAGGGSASCTTAPATTTVPPTATTPATTTTPDTTTTPTTTTPTGTGTDASSTGTGTSTTDTGTPSPQDGSPPPAPAPGSPPPGSPPQGAPPAGSTPPATVTP